jgi:hypothetical protein
VKKINTKNYNRGRTRKLSAIVTEVLNFLVLGNYDGGAHDDSSVIGALETTDNDILTWGVVGKERSC